MSLYKKHLNTSHQVHVMNILRYLYKLRKMKVMCVIVGVFHYMKLQKTPNFAKANIK